MTKIGLDAKRAFLNSRGLGNYSRDTIRILSQYLPNDEFFLFTPKTRNTIEFPYSSNCSIVQPESLFLKKYHALWRTYYLCNKIKDLQLDIFHGLSNELPIGIEKTPARTVVTIHDLIFLKFPHLYPMIDRELYKRKYLRSCRIADKVIAISEQTKMDLLKYTDISEKKIEVVYQSCNPIFLKRFNDEELRSVKKRYDLPPQYLLNVGAIEQRKNQKLIIQALIYGKIDIPLIIIGKPAEYLHELKSLVHMHHLESKVHFLTNVPTTDLPAIYQMAEIFIYPSIFEGFGIPIIEALHSGVPVITSKGSCFEETGGPGTYYVDHESVEEMAEAIHLITNDENRKRRMIDAGLEYVQRFSEKNISSVLENIYRALL